MAHGSVGAGMPGSSGSARSSSRPSSDSSSASHASEKRHVAVDERRRVERGLAAARLLESGGIGMPGRRGIEYDASADGRPVAEDDPVAARRDHRRGEPELGESACLRDARGYGRRAVVDVQPGAVRDRLELLERHIEPVARPQAAGGDERVAATQLAPFDAGERECDPLARLCPLDRAVVHLDAPHPHVAAGRLRAEHVALADRPRPERPGRDRPDSAEREDPVDVEPRRLRVRELVFLKHKLRRAPERGTELVEARAGLRADGDRLRLRHELASPRRARARGSPRRPHRTSSPRRRRARDRAGG